MSMLSGRKSYNEIYADLKSREMENEVLKAKIRQLEAIAGVGVNKQTSSRWSNQPSMRGLGLKTQSSKANNVYAQGEITSPESSTSSQSRRQRLVLGEDGFLQVSFV
jgi:hypothetical protein